MPGLHFFKFLTLQSPDRGIQKLELCRQFAAPADYSVNVLFQDSSCLLCSTGYPDYPIESFRTDKFSFYLDGRLYANSLSSAAAALEKILRRVELGSTSESDKIRDWLLSLDGDFVFFIRNNETGTWYCVNDVLSRLPIYLTQTDDEICVTRDMRLAIATARTNQLKGSALAQYLLFGYSLGSSTILAGVERVRGATFIRIGICDSKSASTTLHTFAFDEWGDFAGRDVQSLIEIFVEACRTRANTGSQSVLGLSGGHDSRVVAAGLHRAQIQTKAYTWVGDDQSDSMETTCAHAVAQKLGLEWTRVPGTPVDRRDMDWVADLKQALVPAYTGWARPFFNKVVSDNSQSAVYFSGDGGDKTLPAIQPSRSFPSIEELAAFLIEREAICDLDTVARLCGQDRRAIESDFCGLLSSYPEKDLSAKIAHFRIYERGFNWLFEGEDRNRSFLWTCSPFYSLPFFRAVMLVPPSRKRYHRFYREFLMSLNRDLANIPDANRGLPISSHKYWLRFAVIGLLERNPRLLNALKRRLRPGSTAASERSRIVAEMLSREIEQRRTALDSGLDLDYLRSLLNQQRGLTADALHNLLTLALTLTDRKV